MPAEGFDAWTLDLIAHHVHWLVSRNAGFNGSDREDLKHDLALAILMAQPLPEGASERRCLHRIVHEAIHDAIEKRTCPTRDWRRTERLPATHKTLREDRRTRRQSAWPGDEAGNVRLDVQQKMASIPPGLRQAAEALLETGSVTKAARSLRLTERQFSGRYLRQLKKHFANSA